MDDDLPPDYHGVGYREAPPMQRLKQLGTELEEWLKARGFTYDGRLGIRRRGGKAYLRVYVSERYGNANRRD